MTERLEFRASCRLWVEPEGTSDVAEPDSSVSLFWVIVMFCSFWRVIGTAQNQWPVAHWSYAGQTRFKFQTAAWKCIKTRGFIVQNPKSKIQNPKCDLPGNVEVPRGFESVIAGLVATRSCRLFPSAMCVVAWGVRDHIQVEMYSVHEDFRNKN
jgi:hypothetical protein